MFAILPPRRAIYATIDTAPSMPRVAIDAAAPPFRRQDYHYFAAADDSAAARRSAAEAGDERVLRGAQ